MLDNIQWLGHASFKITGSPSFMIDPWRVVKDETFAPDVILITHEHYDHCSPADINKLVDGKTLVVASQGAADHLDIPVKVLRPWQTINVGRASIRTVPAYTFSGDHPAKREDLGFIISTNYTDIYYAGDTDFIPELRNLRCDIAILPISGRNGLMNIDAAIEFVQSARPRYVIPSHYGNGAESGGNVEMMAFERALGKLTTVVSLTNHRLARI